MSTLELVVAAIRSLVLLQNRLLQAFKAAFPQVNDWKLLLDFPKAGKLTLNGETWSFRKHGSGLSFLSTAGTNVDIHRRLLNPDVIDAWRVLQYLESTQARNEPSMTEHEIEEQLRQLCLAGKLEAVDDEMYRLTEV